MQQAVRTLILAIFAFVWLVPTYLLLVNASKTSALYSFDRAWVPASPFALLENLAYAAGQTNFGAAVLPTLVYSITGPVLSVTIGTLAAYAMVVLRVRYALPSFMFIYGATIFPAQMLLIPLFRGYVALGIYDTWAGLILVHMAVGLPLATFIMRNFFLGVHSSVYEAAQLDGASKWRILRQIYVPMSSTPIAAVMLLQFTSVWNDLIFGITLAVRDGTRPIMAALSALSGVYGSTVPVILAAGLASSMVTVLLYLLTRRLFIQGLSLGHS